MVPGNEIEEAEADCKTATRNQEQETPGTDPSCERRRRREMLTGSAEGPKLSGREGRSRGQGPGMAAERGRERSQRKMRQERKKRARQMGKE